MTSVLRLALSHLFFAAIASVILISTAALADSLEQAAASEWQNHVYTLRVWVGGDNIEIDENGRVLHGGSPVSWTQARFEVQKVSVHRDKIEFRGNRVGLLYDKDKRQFVKLRLEPLKLVMRIDTSRLQPNDLPHIADSLFITDTAQLLAAMPEFWKSFAMGQVKPGNDGKDGQFNLPDQPNAVRATPAPGAPVGKTVDGEPIFGMPSPGITPPVVLKDSQPAYDEIARRMRIVGVDVLAAVIGQDGSVLDVQIERPLGMGMDERAIEAIRGWRFRPATRDGKPVAVQVKIEMTFHLY
jgi:TonB family protein